MADNSTRTVPTSGTTESIRTEDRGGDIKTQVVLLDVGGTGAEAILGDVGVTLPVVVMGTDVTLPVAPNVASSVADIALSSSTTAAEAAASNANRRSMTVTNTDPYRCYLRWGSSDPSSTDFHFYLESGERYEMPAGAPVGLALRAVWATGAIGTGKLIGWEH